MGCRQDCYLIDYLWVNTILELVAHPWLLTRTLLLAHCAGQTHRFSWCTALHCTGIFVFSVSGRGFLLAFYCGELTLLYTRNLHWYNQ
jgi:hypothetical protein